MTEEQFIITAGDYVTGPVGPFPSEEAAHDYYQSNKPQGVLYLSRPTIERVLRPAPGHPRGFVIDDAEANARNRLTAPLEDPHDDKQAPIFVRLPSLPPIPDDLPEDLRAIAARMAEAYERSRAAAGMLLIPRELHPPDGDDDAFVEEVVAHLREPTRDRRRVPWADVLDFVLDTFHAQQLKHGWKPTSIHRPETSDADRLRALVEEVGEVADAFDLHGAEALDETAVDHLRDELAQVASVALAWLEGLHPDGTVRCFIEDAQRGWRIEHIRAVTYTHHSVKNAAGDDESEPHVTLAWPCGRSVDLGGDYPPRFFDEALRQFHGPTCPE